MSSSSKSSFWFSLWCCHAVTTLTSLCNLLQQTKGFCWGSAQDKAFKKAKKLLTSQNSLVQFDATRELVLSCVASPCGLGAVLSHRALDGTDQPASHTVSKWNRGMLT